jgi:hypothetical protein
MRHSLGGAALLLLAVFILPIVAADDVKDVKKDDPKGVKKDDVKDPAKDDPKKGAAKDAKKEDPKKDAAKDARKEDPKKEIKKDPPVKPEPKKDNGMVKVAQLIATIVTLDETKKSMRLKVDVPKLNVSAAQAIQQGEVEYLQAQATRPVTQDSINRMNITRPTCTPPHPSRWNLLLPRTWSCGCSNPLRSSTTRAKSGD